MSVGFKYRAFISYSHRDRAWGDWLHRALENYRVPQRLVGTAGRDGPVPSTLFPVFRDREELSSSSDLSEQIKAALEQSAFLLVICSPNGATSRWVNEEILTFKRLGRENRILALIVEGEPNAADKTFGEGEEQALECFPQALKFKLGPDGQLTTERTDPLAADARSQGDGKSSAKLKIIAGLLGIAYDALKQRELEAARRRARIYQGTTAFVALLAVFAFAAAWFAFEQRTEARRERDEVVQGQMRLLTQSAEVRLKNADVPGAQAIILEVMANRQPRPIDRSATVNVFQETRSADAEIALLAGHSSVVATAAYSPDGRRVVTASFDNTAGIWDVATGTRLAVLKGHTDGVTSAAYSPDGTRIATSSMDKSARVWDARSGKQIILLSGHTDAVASVGWSPDGMRIITASWDKTARVWDARSGAQLEVLSGHESAVNYAAYSSDGGRIVTSSSDKTARIWNADTGAQLAVLRGHGDVVISAVFSPDSRHIVTASADRTARIWDASSGAQLAELLGHTSDVNFASFSPDGSSIVTASGDNSARLWDAASATQLKMFKEHQGGVNSAAFSPDGKTIVTASYGKAAGLWSANPNSQLALLSRADSVVQWAAYSPDGRRIITAQDNAAYIWDSLSGTRLAVLSGHTSLVESAAYSPDGKHIVTASFDKTARIWDTRTNRQFKVLSGHGGFVFSAAYSPDGRRIVTASFDKTARIWDANTGIQLAVLSGHSNAVASAVWSPDSRRILTASQDETARVWDATTGAQLFALTGHTGGVGSAAYSPDGRHIVTASLDKTARIWDAVTGIQIAILIGHEGGVVSAGYSPDGRRVVTASLDKTVRIWDAASGEQLSVLSGHNDAVSSAAYSSDSRRIISSSSDKTVRIWNGAIPAGLDAQIVWSEAAQFDPMTDDERTQLGLQPDAGIRTWPKNASKCDSATAAPYDPDRRAAGMAQDQIVPEIAISACAGEIAKSGVSSQLTYEMGRALLAKHDIKGARRKFELAVSNGYPAARIDLAELLSDTSAHMLDSNRAVSLYEQAWTKGISLAAFELGYFYERKVQTMGAVARTSRSSDASKIWFWYEKGAEVGEPNSLARFAQRCDTIAATEKSLPKKNASLLDAFGYYSAAVERAQVEGWPEDQLESWRYRRATLARLLAREGMMQEVANSYTNERKRWGPSPPTLLQRLRASIGL